MKCPFCGSSESWYKGVFECCSVHQNGVCKEHMRAQPCLRAERDKLKATVARLEAAGDALDEAADAAADDIREHLQVANYNLHGLINTGERIEPPNPPRIIHQGGIDVSVAVRENIRKARRGWKVAKEVTP